MYHHDLHFLNDVKLARAKQYFEQELSPEERSSMLVEHDKITFQTSHKLNTPAQVKILDKISSYMPVFNIFDAEEQGGSEVARLREEIESEYAAMQNAQEFALTARHDFIYARLEGVEKNRRVLAGIVGEETATNIMVKSYEQVMES